MGEATRKETVKLLREHRITVNGSYPVSASTKIDEKNDTIALDGRAIEPPRIVVCIMHKPSGYVTSTSDSRDKTVMSLLPENLARQGVVPVGRLDKDTEGLLVFTNDGNLHHRLISPKREVEKEYLVIHEGDYDEKTIDDFKNGLTLKDGTECKGAKLVRLDRGKSLITITEGKYHQVKRMMASKGLRVEYLKRIREGQLKLGSLERGKVRELSETEIEGLEKK